MLVRGTAENIRGFVRYAQSLSGDEKGEAQVFCDRLFQAFGHEGYKEAGATLEFRVRGKGKRTRFADLLWRPRLLLEMKKPNYPLEGREGAFALIVSALKVWLGQKLDSSPEKQPQISCNVRYETSV